MHIDDSLDVFGAHGLGGITGALLTGIFVSTAWGGDVNGSIGQFATQLAAVVHSPMPSALRMAPVAAGSARAAEAAWAS